MRSQRNLIFSRSSGCPLAVVYVLFRCGAGLLFLFGAVERAVGAVLHCNHVLPGKGGRAKGDRRQNGKHLAPLCQQSLQRFCAAGFAFLVLQQHAEFIAADASADTAFADGILQKLSDKADGEVPFFMPVSVVDDL